MITLANKIGLDKALINSLADLQKKKSKKICRLCDKCLKHGFHRLHRQNDLMRLAVILEAAKRLKARYDEKGIDEKIYYDTLSDIRIWCEEDDNKGLKNYGWLQNHVKFELFRLGRLQFQLYTCNNPTLDYSRLPFSFGEKVIYVHIPSGQKLLPQDCISSFQQADAFFKTYFPHFSYRFYFSESWLLFEGNREFMDKGSNIVSFMKLFTIHYSATDDRQAIERIFKTKQKDISLYQEKTALQKQAKSYMLEGKKLGVGIGTRERSLESLREQPSTAQKP